MALLDPSKSRGFWNILLDMIAYAQAISLFTAGTTVTQAVTIITAQRDAN